MLDPETQHYYLPMVVRPWSRPGQAAKDHKPYVELHLTDLLGISNSCGFIPVYASAAALRCNHPSAVDLFFKGDTRFFPALLYRWTCDYRPAESVGLVPAYRYAAALREDFPQGHYTMTELAPVELQLPKIGGMQHIDFLELSSMHDPMERAEVVISPPNKTGVPSG